MISFAMLTVLSVLDALSKADLLSPDASFSDNLWFMILRAPLLYDQVLSFAFLLSLLVTYVMLIRRNELVAVAGAGLSAWAQIRALTPAVMLASLLSLGMIDQAAPGAQEALTSWLGPNAVTKDATRANELWLSDGAALVRVQTLEGDTLRDVMLFERSDAGKIGAVSHAKTATQVEGGWKLNDVTQTRFDGAAIDLPETWQSAQTPRTLNLLLLEPRYLSAADLWLLSRLQGKGNRASSDYLVWLYGRAGVPLMAFGFLMITVFVMQQFGRDPKPEIALVIVMGGGFLFAVASNISKTLPERAGTDPAFAALAPVACVLIVGLCLSLRNPEGQ